MGDTVLMEEREGEPDTDSDVAGEGKGRERFDSGIPKGTPRDVAFALELDVPVLVPVLMVLVMVGRGLNGIVDGKAVIG